MLGKSELVASPRIRLVSSFDELVCARFEGDVNALCWPRRLAGDFQEVLDKLCLEPGVAPIGEDDLRALLLSPAGALARDVLLADQQRLRAHGLSPTLDRITRYDSDDTAGPIPTDVYSFHVDSAPLEADTYLCTYVGATSEGLANEAAIRRVDEPATRAELLKLYGGSDDASFAAVLQDNSFDLHYAPLPGAEPYAFGLGNMWRIAIAYPNAPVLPCIHRAPAMPPGAPARLLLIS